MKIPRLFNLKGFTYFDTLDHLKKNRAKFILTTITSVMLSIVVAYTAVNIFKVITFKSVWVEVFGVLIFGFLYPLIFTTLRKSSSVVIILLILIPFFVVDVYLEAMVRLNYGIPIWDYQNWLLDGRPFYQRSLIWLGTLSLFLGPIMLWISRFVAHFFIDKSNYEQYKKNKDSELFSFVGISKKSSEEKIGNWTKDEVTVPPRKRPFFLKLEHKPASFFKRIGAILKNGINWAKIYFILIRLFTLYFSFFTLFLIVGSFSAGGQLFSGDAQLLLDKTYVNPIQCVNFFGKLSLLIILGLHAGFNKSTRWFSLLALLVAHIISTVATLGFRFFVPNSEKTQELLLTAAIPDLILVVILFILWRLSKKHRGKEFELNKNLPKDLSSAYRLNIWLFIAIAFISLSYCAYIAWDRFDGYDSIFYSVEKGDVDYILYNTFTFWGGLGFTAFLCARWNNLKRYFVHVLSGALLSSIIISLFWLLILQTKDLGFGPETNLYLIGYFMVAQLIVGLLWVLRRLTYNVDYQITALSPPEAMTSEAAVQSFFEEENVNAYESVRKIDGYLSSTKGRKRGLINFPFWFLENILSLIYGYRPPFSMMDKVERNYFLKRFIFRLPQERKRALIPALSEVSFLLGTSIRALLTLAHFTTDTGKKSVNYIPLEERRRSSTSATQKTVSTPEVTKTYKTKEKLDKEVLLKHIMANIGRKIDEAQAYDYIIVGSGAGGAVMAYRLSQMEGQDPSKILLIEKGKRNSPANDMVDDELVMLARLYKDGGLQQTQKFDMVVLQGEALGGTTVINNAVCFEMKDRTKAVWREEEKGFGLKFWEKSTNGKTLLENEYELIKEEINIHPLDDKAINQTVKDLFIKGVEGGVENVILSEPENVLVNAKNEKGDELWNSGNKRAEKLTMAATYIRWAEEAGIHILDNTNVINFNFAETNGKTQIATEILVRSRDGQLRRIKINKSLIIAAGCLGSSQILLRSNIENPNIGKQLSCNYAFPVTLEYDKTIKAFEGNQITMATYDEANHLVYETYFNPPAAFALTLPFNFDTFKNTMTNYDKLLNFGVLIGSENSGEMFADPSLIDGRSFKWEITEADSEKIKTAFKTMIQIGKNSGAKSAILPMRPGIKLNLLKEEEVTKFLELLDNHPLSKQDLIISTAHPQGGNLMSANVNEQGNNRVVDENFKLVDFDNVHVVDASIFPTSLGVNPQWTILALSSLAAKKM